MLEYSISQLGNRGRYKRKGVIDRLMIAPDGAYDIHGYKAGSKLPEQKVEEKP